jgi:hypothetical protein
MTEAWKRRRPENGDPFVTTLAQDSIPKLKTSQLLMGRGLKGSIGDRCGLAKIGLHPLPVVLGGAEPCQLARMEGGQPSPFAGIGVVIYERRPVF